MAINQNKFNFFVPVQFEKSETGSEGPMKIKGVCSSKVEDTDGETLHPSGFNFAPLLEKGFLNWNHQANKTASAIIGRPTKAEVINNGEDFYIEGYLYKGLDEARFVYNLARTLEEEDPDRRLGFSIEGKADLRDSLNPKKILKATITGVAITPCPKNPNTLLSLMKGDYSDSFIEDVEDGTTSTDYSKEVEQLFDAYSNWSQPGDSNYGTESHVEDFMRYSNEDNILLVPVLCQYIADKAMTAEAGDRVTSKESVEGGVKILDGVSSASRSLKKSEVYSQIVEKYQITEIEKAKEIYSFIEKVNQKLFNMNPNEAITQEVLKKSFEALETQIQLVKSEDEKEKLDPDADSKPKEEEEVEEENEEVSKAIELAKDCISKGMSRDECVEDMIRKGFSLIVSQSAVESVLADANANFDGGKVEEVSSSPLENKVTVENGVGLLVSQGVKTTIIKSNIEVELEQLKEKLEKAEGSLELLQSQNLSLQKAEVDFSPVEDLIKSQTQEFGSRFQAIAKILKSQTEQTEKQTSELSSKLEELEGTNLELKKSNDALVNRLETVERTSQGRRSVTTVAAVERFQKSDVVDDLNTYSLSKASDVDALSNKLLAQYDLVKSSGREDNALFRAIQDIEISRYVDASFMPRLEAMGLKVTV